MDLPPSAAETRTRFLFTTAIVAVLDISFAGTYWVVIRGATTFPRIFQSIAAGLLGKAAFQGGSQTVILGAILHCVVAAGWTGVFFVAVRYWRGLGALLQRPAGALIAGMPYGVFVWLMMTLAIIPLSRTTPASVASTWFWISLAWHAVGVGLPIAIGANPRSRHERSEGQPRS